LIATSWAIAINEAGVIAGHGDIPAVESPYFAGRAFVYQNGLITRIEPFDGHRHTGISALSDTVTAFGVSSGNDIETTFIWSNGRMVDLHSLLVQSREIEGLIVRDVSPDETIVGQAHLPFGRVAAFIARPTPTSPADLNLDCRVNVTDLLGVLAVWGSADPAADINNDEVVDHFDLLFVVSEWGSSGIRVGK
jgi:hypothetical protein